MKVAAWWVRIPCAAAMLAGSGLVTACGGGQGPDNVADTAAVPVPQHGTPTPVDVCGLVTGADTAAVAGRSLRPVGLEFAAARVATLQCDLGTTFAEPILSVALAVGPVSAEVFNDAYGEAAGGDPAVVDRLGEGAVVRKEGGQISVHVLVHSSIVTVSATLDTARPIRRAVLLDLAGDALARLPGNPVVESTNPRRQCAQVPVRAVAAGVGARPALSGELSGADGSVMCSWTALPGSAVVTVFRSPYAVATYDRLARASVYRRVDLPSAGANVQALSRDDRAGDLLILTGSSAIVVMVLPTAGFSDREIPTTPGEVVLASAVVRALT